MIDKDGATVAAAAAAALETYRARQASHIGLMLLMTDLARDRAGSYGTGSRSPAPIYLARDEETHFWELIGLRVRGLDFTFLGAIRFERLPSGFTPNARRSLLSRLTDLPRDAAAAGPPNRGHLLEVLIPDVRESVPEFLERMRAGARPRPVMVDTDLIELAFDFRVENPVSETVARMPDELPVRYAFRTVDGHVLTGRCTALDAQLRENQGFFIVTDVVQHTPSDRVALPVLMLRRDFVTMAARFDTEPAEEWIAGVFPFAPAGANPSALLG